MTTRVLHREPRSGIRKWVDDRVAKFKSAWQDAGSGALYWMRRVWDWLHTLARPDEAMLARLRSARRIKLHHPAARSEADVLGEWQSYLTRQGRRHLFLVRCQRSDHAVCHRTLYFARSERDRDLVRLSGRSPHDRRLGNQSRCNGTRFRQSFIR